ncbi:MAG: tRNA (guanosine(46)-N7)-methyltransferase TrmB [Treponema sp.]|nr:tRNA (guanosine(46)-N7)-methyltransferase TrmB [Treponema sp.]
MRPRSFVLRSGRMSAAQKRSYRALYSRWCIPFGNGALDFEKIFGNRNPVTAEIGFGMGESTALAASENPGVNYVGVEVYKAGIGKLLWEIDRRGLANIRIIEHDAAEVVEHMIGAASLDAFHIFFPDPWPKKRHHKRRLLALPFTGLLAAGLKSGGYISFATDWEDYAVWALGELSRTAGLVNPYGEGFAPRPAWRPETKFERKGIAKGRQIRELYFIRS